MNNILLSLIIFTAQSPSENTTAPYFPNSGWELQGHWGNYLGTPISSNRFITAKHVGGSVGQVFTIWGSNYTTVELADDSFGDLRIWKVDGVFSNWATLYTGAGEQGQGVMIFGRGAVKGDEVWTTNVSTFQVASGPKRQPTVLTQAGTVSRARSIQTLAVDVPVFHGWKTGTNDLQLRWGVQEIWAAGALLVSQFNAVSRGSEACLAAGDSGGGAFIQDGSVFKLCGVNYAVQGPFSITEEGEQFYGGIFDFGGLWWDGFHFPYQSTPQPSVMYFSRTSTRMAWINSVLSSP